METPIVWELLLHFKRSDWIRNGFFRSFDFCWPVYFISLDLSYVHSGNPDSERFLHVVATLKYPVRSTMPYLFTWYDSSTYQLVCSSVRASQNKSCWFSLLLKNTCQWWCRAELSWREYKNEWMNEWIIVRILIVVVCR